MITDNPLRPDDFFPDVSDSNSGAVVTFAGVVRDDKKDGRRVVSIHYDCHREMAEKEISGIAEEFGDPETGTVVRIVHRIGDVPAGETSLLVVVSSRHRKEAFDVSRAVVDEIKHRVPIWKKEVYDDGSSEWL